MERYAEGEKRWDLRFGVVTSGYVNCHLREGATPIPAGRWFGYEEPAELKDAAGVQADFQSAMQRAMGGH